MTVGTHAVWALTVLATGMTLAAQTPSVPSQPAGTGAPGAATVCLSDQEIGTMKLLRELSRPTTGEDPAWPFDPEYFVGSWAFEGDVPESALGQAGTIRGTVSFRHVDGCHYEGELQAMGPDGAWKQRIQIVYTRGANWKHLTWIEADSRGFTVLKPGALGGDQGGYFTHHWEAPAFRYRGQDIRLRGSTFLSSPWNYRQRMTISVDGGPFVNYGNPWFQKAGAPRGR